MIVYKSDQKKKFESFVCLTLLSLLKKVLKPGLNVIHKCVDVLY